MLAIKGRCQVSWDSRQAGGWTATSRGTGPQRPGHHWPAGEADRWAGRWVACCSR